MTYVAGICIRYMNMHTSAILCDTKCSFADEAEGREAPAFKNGLLFDGCIYGASGDVDCIIRFVSHCKAAFSKSKMSSKRIWKSFEESLATYSFDGFDNFEMILSSNESGEPVLYRLDPESEERLVKCETPKEHNCTIVSIGSGKSLLDSALHEFVLNNNKIGFNKLKDSDFPYILNAWFMRHARGDFAAELAKDGVGGFFHFWTQTKIASKPQKPTLHVLMAEFSGKLVPYCYRIAYLNNGNILVIHDLNENDRHILQNIWDPNDPRLKTVARTAASLKREGIFHESISNYETDSEWVADAVLKFEKLSFYYFCSVGFPSSNDRLQISHFRRKRGAYWIRVEDFSAQEIAARDKEPMRRVTIIALQQKFVNNLAYGYMDRSTNKFLRPGEIHPWRRYLESLERRVGHAIDENAYIDLVYVDDEVD
jgi:hypothetical protein